MMKLVCNILYIKKKDKYLRYLIAFFIIVFFLINIKYLIKKNNFGVFTIVNNCDYFSLGISIKKYSKIFEFISRKFFMKNRTIINNKKKISTIKHFKILLLCIKNYLS